MLCISISVYRIELGVPMIVHGQLRRSVPKHVVRFHRRDSGFHTFSIVVVPAWLICMHDVHQVGLIDGKDGSYTLHALSNYLRLVQRMRQMERYSWTYNISA